MKINYKYLQNRSIIPTKNKGYKFFDLINAISTVVTFFIGSKEENAVYGEEKKHASLVLSQFALLESRKRVGIMYMLVTVSGIFVPAVAVFSSIENIYNHDRSPLLTTLLLKNAPLIVATSLIATGTFVLNDLVDADLDKSSGKERPISSGHVTKAQASIFVTATNAAAIILALITSNLLSISIVLALVGLGLMYSLPKICLKDRFVLKTLSLFTGTMLCFMLGSSYAFNISGTIHENYNYTSSTINSLLISIYAASMSGSLVVIISLLNDLGDVEGDKIFGKKTIPVVICKKNTVIVTMLIAATMIVTSWVSFYMLPTNLGLICTILVTLVAMIAATGMAETLKHLSDHKFIRKQHKKSILWHLILQSALIAGPLLLWIK